MGNLDHQLPGTNSCNDVLTQRFLFDLVGELLRCLVIYIRFQQGFTDIFDRLGNINFGDATLTLAGS